MTKQPKYKTESLRRRPRAGEPYHPVAADYGTSGTPPSGPGAALRSQNVDLPSPLTRCTSVKAAKNQCFYSLNQIDWHEYRRCDAEKIKKKL